ncbi:phosphotransferase enzyme family protein [Pochonia chlamydosporia 170]|uniref:Phosphotransferase enzyme family protein n=1 Tax=Pochonia chlamydosporia 170 TaxID=1380566 RepID=A0A179EZZ6_METCM|nr:phosphotransferase enzyme family protein [Pochonia chlamydosporia 170]OAQ58756.2 phosphotransferase enzyme family protein [Pochonia chlamydosporia 170]
MSLDTSAETSPRLPFFALQSRLPAPLPTAEEIETSSELLQEYTGRRIVRFGDHYIIKYGLNVSPVEGENMLLIGKILPAHVPEVYAIYSTKNEEGGLVYYIIMERIAGHGLDALWNGLDSARKTEIARKLRSCLDTVRRLPSPGYFGCIGRRKFEDSMFWVAPDDDSLSSTISGPFESESLLNSALIEKYLYNSGLDQKAAFYRRVLPLILRGHKPVFTHGDLHRKNVILRENGELVLLDWEAAGWYPEYWEYAMAMFACGAWQDDWHEFLGQVLVEYPTEYAWFDMLRREIWS